MSIKERTDSITLACPRGRKDSELNYCNNDSKWTGQLKTEILGNKCVKHIFLQYPVPQEIISCWWNTQDNRRNIFFLTLKIFFIFWKWHNCGKIQYTEILRKRLFLKCFILLLLSSIFSVFSTTIFSPWQIPCCACLHEPNVASTALSEKSQSLHDLCV